MGSQTATIRVPRGTRDLLARQARARDVSLAAYLTHIGREREREEMVRSEREASRADAANPEALAEYRVWEATLADGID